MNFEVVLFFLSLSFFFIEEEEQALELTASE